MACFIAFRVAKRRGWHYRLVHIDTTISLRVTQEYVRHYAQWLGAELVVLRPEKTFKEYAEKYGMWPSLYPQRFRWCYRDLKLQPLIKYLKESYKEGDLVVMGVRKSESRFRDKFYTATFFTRDYDGVKARIWTPLLFIDEPVLVRLVERFEIPKNPVWKYGFSGECLCLAGAPLHEVALILRYFPERDMLLEIDKAIQRNRKSGRPSAPFRLAQAGYRTLEEFYKQVVRSQLTLDDFLPYAGKACQGSCML